VSLTRRFRVQVGDSDARAETQDGRLETTGCSSQVTTSKMLARRRSRPAGRHPRSRLHGRQSEFSLPGMTRLVLRCTTIGGRRGLRGGYVTRSRIVASDPEKHKNPENKILQVLLSLPSLCRRPPFLNLILIFWSVSFVVDIDRGKQFIVK
jgi:hypothetical protein